jgi:hypothetical protein
LYYNGEYFNLPTSRLAISSAVTLASVPTAPPFPAW